MKSNVAILEQDKDEIDKGLVNLLQLQKELDEKLKKLTRRIFLIVGE